MEPIANAFFGGRRHDRIALGTCSGKRDMEAGDICHGADDGDLETVAQPLAAAIVVEKGPDLRFEVR